MTSSEMEAFCGVHFDFLVGKKKRAVSQDACNRGKGVGGRHDKW